MKSINGGRPRGPARTGRMTLDPESIAIEALAFLAAEPDRLDRFLSLTGLDPAGLRAMATGSGFVDAVLFYVASDETVLVAFAQASGHPPEAVGQLVRAIAEGGARDEGA